MNPLQDKILKDGKIIDNNVLLVDSFINHQIDTKLLRYISKTVAKRYKGKVNKVLTIEASGIPFAVGVAERLGNLPVVVAKKSFSKVLNEKDCYITQVESFTKGNVCPLTIKKEFISKGDKILVMDDFLAKGNASLALLDICNQAGAEIVAFAFAIEKRFQGGHEKLEKLGYDIFAVASLDEIKDCKVAFYNKQK